MTFDSGQVLGWIGTIVLALLGVVFGGPITQAWRNRRRSEETAGDHLARATKARAHLEETEYRSTDAAIERWSARAERAEKGERLALEDKRLAIEQAQRLVEEARTDVHDTKNAAMASIAAAEKACKAEIQRIEHAAEARIAQARGEVAVLMDRLAERDALIASLTVRIEECQRQNTELNAELDRKFPRARFDPSKSELQGE